MTLVPLLRFVTTRFRPLPAGSRWSMADKLPTEALGPDQARKLIARDGTQALDIRDDDDFADGHIAGATHASKPEVESLVEELSQDDPVIVVCADGERSAKVAGDLRDKGYD